MLHDDKSPRILVRTSDGSSDGLYRGRLIQEDGQWFAVADHIPGAAPFEPERILLDSSDLEELPDDGSGVRIYRYRAVVRLPKR
jgi:hypothetical protein